MKYGFAIAALTAGALATPALRPEKANLDVFAVPPVITPAPLLSGSVSSKLTSRKGSSKPQLPQSKGSSALASVQTVAAGQSFDGGMVMYDRGVSCTGQVEGGNSDAVFILEEGAKLSNIIIGPNQIEGVYCMGNCLIHNVWWSDVCEDAFSIKKQKASDTTSIVGGGAFGAEDKVIQHNGGGSVSISGFYAENFGKLYRSCGNCKTQYQRHVTISGVSATHGDVLAGINSNYGDTASIENVQISEVKDVCVKYKGNDSGAEPSKTASGADGKNCIYSPGDFGASS